MEAKRVAAQLQLMAEQLDRLANRILSQVKNELFNLYLGK